MIERLGEAEDVNMRWLDCVINGFDEFVQDHADCERRSSTMAMSIVAKHPEKDKAVPSLINIAVQKLTRFQKVYHFMTEKRIQLPPEISHNLYVKHLTWLAKNGKEDRFLDKLLIAGIIESREQQRLKLLYDHINDPVARSMYDGLFAINNVSSYYDLALHYFPEQTVNPRLGELLKEEAIILKKLDICPALH
jgi:tRNA-(ms[2]io[6]A)-hydroxylase